MVNLTIDGKLVTVKEGTLVVDAARQIGVDIPVFCYHPKMEPVGMCRMCLVDIGRPMIDRTTGQPVREVDGSPRIQFMPKLETACTTPVSEGMVVVTESAKIKASRKEVLEFILTSHPLDCPICDKGGECPLQNLTMAYGPGKSRFLFDDKMHNQKHVPLGDLILLDRERCIQCGRCVRFQDTVVDDPVISFYMRGRALEIVTHSEPGFDSIFSGNTTDICPVGALTTIDFHFKARPWELKSVASICTHCPVGCNLALNVRREAAVGGKVVVKRVMPRQNESVNEIWICDKGRFAHHYEASPARLNQPLLRKQGKHIPVSWDEALDFAAEKIKHAGNRLLTLAGGRLSNEDFYNLHRLTTARHGKPTLATYMAGGDLTGKLGLTPGSNLADLGKGSAILVAACDLHEEAPIWWLRVKQAAQRGATLVVANPRSTRLDLYASHRLMYAYGSESEAILSLLPVASGSAAAKSLAEAENLVIFFGSEGLGLEGSARLARACAELLIQTGHTGKPNNGLVGVWHSPNLQGAWDIGFRPNPSLVEDIRSLAGEGAAYIVAADPAGDDPELADALKQAGTVIVQDLFYTETARMADLVLPAAAFTERDGTYTSGERRVQRFYPAVTPLTGPLPDFAIAAKIAARLGVNLEAQFAPLIMLKSIANDIPDYAGISYPRLAEVKPQYPILGRMDVYYGGTSYDNQHGLGITLPNAAMRRETLDLPPMIPTSQQHLGDVFLAPITRLYDQGITLQPSHLLDARKTQPVLGIHPRAAAALALSEGERVAIEQTGRRFEAAIHLDNTIPYETGRVIYLTLPRSCRLPANQPGWVTLNKITNQLPVEG
ncbi:MAG TPA: NADH-quinone oxidoreductase subunit NuoG [Anaerolineaceae bacterium]